jgi:hypothetical protein
MGRPLKIAKAQAILTITATDASTEEVTVSQTLANFGVIAGMPFVVASNVGGLIAGTTYWILAVTAASKFTASATDLSSNVNRTPVNLSATSGQSVSASVGVVDAYFNNPVSGAGYPETNTETYSVVGGNTGIYGKQVLVRCAIGVNGTGTIYSYDDGNVIGGIGTDFANTFSAGSIIQSVNSETGEATTLGFVDTVTGYVEIEVSNATATGNFITSVGNAQTLVANLPLTLDTNIGGLTTGTIYFVKQIVNAAAFTVSLTPGGANVALTNANVTANVTQDQVLLDANALANTANASFIYADNEAGFIVRQKGKQKYLVTGATSGLTAPCFTANVANAALTPNTMSIIATYANTNTTLVQSLSDHTLEIFGTGNVLPNSSPAFATFNTAYAANTYGGQPYPIVTINNA